MWMKFNSLATPQQDSAAGQEEDTVTYRQFALGILGARIYQGNNPAVLIAQPAVLDFDRDGAALILDAGVVQPGERVRVSFFLENDLPDDSVQQMLERVPASVRYVIPVEAGLRVGVQFDYRTSVFAGSIRVRARAVERLLSDWSGDYGSGTGRHALLPAGYRQGGRIQRVVSGC